MRRTADVEVTTVFGEVACRRFPMGPLRMPQRAFLDLRKRLA